MSIFSRICFAIFIPCALAPASLAEFKPALARLALDRDRVQPGGVVQAAYTFRSRGPSSEEFKVFVHVVGPGGLRIGADFSPVMLTTRWPQEGWLREGPFSIELPADAPPGKYEVLIGLYSSSERAELDNADLHKGGREYHAGDFQVVAAGSTATAKPAVFDWLPVDDTKLAKAPPPVTVRPGEKTLERLMVSVDRKVLNPVHEKNPTAKLTVTGFYSGGSQRVLPPAEVELKARTKSASGHVNVVAIENGKVVPKEGGIATIEATVTEAGRRVKASTDVVVTPYYRDYHQTLVLKLFMGMEGEPVPRSAGGFLSKKGHEVMCTFEEAFEIIRKTDNLTRGMPKIVYLVGWQKGGHDHGYPAWSEVNPLLKRSQDDTPLKSLRWLIREGRKFNTTVSLHLNMVDAYKHSPLFNEYAAKDCFARDANGQLLVAGIQIQGDDMLNVVYPKEWEAGLAQRRIDGLIKMIPELKDGHTIHVDVFVSQRDGGKPISPWHAKPENGGLTVDKYVETQRKIFHYWRERGFDVTGEGTGWAHPPGEHFVGLQPMSWWYSWNQMEIPECLGARGRTDRGGDGDFRFGSSMHGEEIWQDMWVKGTKEKMTGFQGMFCRSTLPWYYLSRLERVKLESNALHYSDGVVARTEGGKRIIRKGDFVLREDDHLFVPALWNGKEIIAYSRPGYASKTWQLPEDWKGIRSVDLYQITMEGCALLQKRVPVTGARLVLSLDKDQSVSILPAGKKPAGRIIAAVPPTNDPTRAEGGNPEWRLRHAERVADVKSQAEKLEILFLGDSITSGWRDTGRAIWEKEFVPRHAVSIGIAGSQTQHVLWQIENGAIEGIKPRVAVLMIGVNNVMARPPHSSPEIARGITAIVGTLRAKLPNTQVLLLGTFPKDRSPDSADRRKIQEVNSLICKLDNGKTVRFTDLTPKLLDRQGALSPEISPDGVHLSPAGYAIWAGVVKELIAP